MFLPGENLPQGLILTEQFTYKSLPPHPLSFQMGILCTCEDRPGTFQTLPPLIKCIYLLSSILTWHLKFNYWDIFYSLSINWLELGKNQFMNQDHVTDGKIQDYNHYLGKTTCKQVTLKASEQDEWWRLIQMYSTRHSRIICME